MNTPQRYIRVANLDRFQHYKDRNPPWIKLHNELLDNYDFARLQDASKSHLMCIWLLASRCDNRIPADPKWIASRIGATTPVDLDALASAGFIEWCEPASTMLAPCAQSAESEGESEGESETDARKSPRQGRRKTPRPDNGSSGFDRFWAAWPRHIRKKGRSKCQRHWASAGLDPLIDQIIAAIERLKTSRQWTKQAGEFIPAPLSWLRDEGWEAPAEGAEVRASSNVDDELAVGERFVPAPFTRELAEAIGAPWPPPGRDEDGNLLAILEGK